MKNTKIQKNIHVFQKKNLADVLNIIYSSWLVNRDKFGLPLAVREGPHCRRVVTSDMVYEGMLVSENGNTERESEQNKRRRTVECDRIDRRQC